MLLLRQLLDDVLCSLFSVLCEQGVPGVMPGVHCRVLLGAGTTAHCLTERLKVETVLLGVSANNCTTN